MRETGPEPGLGRRSSPVQFTVKRVPWKHICEGWLPDQQGFSGSCFQIKKRREDWELGGVMALLPRPYEHSARLGTLQEALKGSGSQKGTVHALCTRKWKASTEVSISAPGDKSGAQELQQLKQNKAENPVHP